MNIDIEKEEYDKIAEIIHSDNSPVGIDAKKTLSNQDLANGIL